MSSSLDESKNSAITKSKNSATKIASLPFAPVDSDVKTLAHFSLHPDADVARH